MLRAFSVSEMKLYKHATTHKWTADELISTIKLIKSVNFRVDDINVDLHKRVSAAIALLAQGYFSTGLFYYVSDSVVSVLLVSSWQIGWYRGGIPYAWYAGVLQQYSIRAKKTASSRGEAPTGLQTASQNYGISTIYLRYISKICAHMFMLGI